jgi:hypothetical protein
MPSRPVRSFLPAAVTLAGLLLSACDQWALLVNSDGVLSITIISDGDGPGRFRVRASQGGATRVLDVPASGRLSSSDFNAGEVELTLLPPAGCEVSGPNPRTLTVSAGEAVNVAFDVHCG